MRKQLTRCAIVASIAVATAAMAPKSRRFPTRPVANEPCFDCRTAQKDHRYVFSAYRP